MFKYLALLALLVIIILFYFRSASNNKVAAANIEMGNKFLTQNKELDGVIETASGLQYQYISKGNGDIHPRATDRVRVHYKGSLLDGRVFDSSIDRGTPISFGLNQVISGWTEGLQLMVAGDKVRFFIPAKLGYRNKSAGIIEPGSTLIFEVELLSIE